MKRLTILLSAGLGACILVAIIVGALDSTAQLPPVTPDGTDNVADFSGARAMKHLESIATEPHPWYSQANERVFQYILSYGESLASKYGTDVIETSIQNATGNYEHYYGTNGWEYKYGSIINVAFLIKGQTTGVDGAAIQVSAHYDGVSTGPAATDDGAGCAVMLELASVLASKSAKSNKLERDVLILFVDAEEVALVGAKYWARGYDDAGNDIFHPWSTLPSFAINIEGTGTASSGAMLIRSNSQFATDAYRRYAPYPKAFSLTEWIYKTIAIGRTDSDIYWTQGIHVMDLIWVENRWAYHSQDDSVENVKSASVQRSGDNILSIVAGASGSEEFPGRIPEQELVRDGINMGSCGCTIGMESGTVYFSLLGGTMVYMPLAFARVMYTILAIIMGLTMPFLGDRNYDTEATEEQESSSSFQQVMGVVCSKRFATESARQTLFALLNFLVGLLTPVLAFAAFGMWKAPTEQEVERREGWYGSEIVAWAGVGSARTFLSLFTVFGTAFLVYTPIRAGRRCCKRNEYETVEGDERNIEVDQTDEECKGEETSNRENTKNGNLLSDIPAQSKANASDSNGQEHRLEQLGRNAHVGVFYFYNILLLLLGAIMPDAACLVLWQPICMWFASLVDVFICRWIQNNQEGTEASHASSQFGRWLLKALLSSFPALLLLPAGIYIFVNVFGYFMDDLGYWFGAPLVDSFCFGLILPLFTPIWIPLPRKAFLVLSASCGLAWIMTAISCMVI